MILTSANDVAGHRVVESLGLVKGSTIRARNLGHDIVAGLKGLVGGEIEEYTKMMAEAREQAVDRMVADAKALGANAVVAVRFSTSDVMQAAAEILVYGSAVRIEPSESRGA